MTDLPSIAAREAGDIADEAERAGRLLADFAYKHGFHEMGYDPIGTLATLSRGLNTEIVALRAQLSRLTAALATARSEALERAVYALEQSAAPLLPQTTATTHDGREVTACDGHAPEYEFFLELERRFRDAIRALKRGDQ